MSILSGEFAKVERVTRTITGLSWLRVPITLRPCCYSLDHKGRSGTNKLDQYSRYTSRSTTLPLAVSICNTNMVNADTAPALPWGASNERDNVQQAGTSSSRLSHSLTTAESEPDHTGTPQVEEAWPSSGSSIEVNCHFAYLWRVPLAYSGQLLFGEGPDSRKYHQPCVTSHR